MRKNEINVKFNEWSKDRLDQGIKTATARKKKKGKPGDIFQVRIRGRVRWYRVTKVKHLTLDDVARYHWREEGAKHAQDFVDQWKEIYPEETYDHMMKVWFHKFEEMIK